MQLVLSKFALDQPAAVLFEIVCNIEHNLRKKNKKKTHPYEMLKILTMPQLILLLGVARWGFSGSSLGSAPLSTHSIFAAVLILSHRLIPVMKQDTTVCLCMFWWTSTSAATAETASRQLFTFVTTLDA